jgi:osmotically-inducible protein OsmY
MLRPWSGHQHLRRRPATLAVVSPLKGKPMNKLNLTQAVALAATVAAMALTGCSRRDDDRTVGQKLDSAIAKSEQKAEQAKADMKQSTAAAGDKLQVGVEDASITASVNAELAKDPTLSALRINVDTDHGRVMLKGTAPDADSRERATRLAQAVKGVVSVDNRLEVRA